MSYNTRFLSFNLDDVEEDNSQAIKIRKNKINDSIIYKDYDGNIVGVNFEEIERLFSELQPYGDLLIKNLNPTLNECFEQLKIYGENLRGTDEYYDSFYNMAINYFGNTSRKLYTVGGYFAGCLNRNGCDLLCAGALSPPANDEWYYCNSAVFYASLESNNYTFVRLNDPLDKSRAVIYIKDVTSYKLFAGFTRKEINELKEYGIRMVILCSDNDEQTKLLDSFISIDDLKTRRETNDTNAFLWIFLGIIVLAILFFIIFRYTDYKSSPNSNKRYVRRRVRGDFGSAFSLR